MSQIDLVYFAHPVVGDFEGTPEQVVAVVQSNLRRASLWLEFLYHVYPNLAFESSWMQLVALLPDRAMARSRGMRDDAINAARCNAAVLCGGKLSSGMLVEVKSVLTGARQVYEPVPMSHVLNDYQPVSDPRYVLDLLDLGPMPPPIGWAVGLRGEMADRLAAAREHGNNWNVDGGSSPRAAIVGGIPGAGTFQLK